MEERSDEVSAHKRRGEGGYRLKVPDGAWFGSLRGRRTKFCGTCCLSCGVLRAGVCRGTATGLGCRGVVWGGMVEERN
jgi:hypothetical protein